MTFGFGGVKSRLKNYSTSEINPRFWTMEYEKC
jgi:hypothetical protein